MFLLENRHHSVLHACSIVISVLSLACIAAFVPCMVVTSISIPWWLMQVQEELRRLQSDRSHHPGPGYSTLRRFGSRVPGVGKCRRM